MVYTPWAYTGTTILVFLGVAGNTSAAEHFKALAETRREAFDLVFWNETEGLWLDWDLDKEGNLEGFYASSLVPLYWGCGQQNVTRHEMVLAR